MDFAWKDLRAGDVVLMLGQGELSKLLAWNGDSLYSHGFLVYDAQTLVEAATAGVRVLPLAERARDRDEVVYADAYRPLTRGGSEFDPAQQAAVHAIATAYRGKPYALDILAQLAVVVALRNKLPAHWLARLVIREAVDHLVKQDPSHVVCTELVYRCLDEADIQPPHALSPRIMLEAPNHPPLPEIDWWALYRECRQILRPHALTTAPAAMQAGPDLPDPSSAPDTERLMGDLAALRDRLTAGHLPLSSANAAMDAVSPDPHGLEIGRATGVEIPRPNPKTIIPLDLEVSPSLRRLGRLPIG